MNWFHYIRSCEYLLNIGWILIGMIVGMSVKVIEEEIKDARPKKKT